RRAISAYAKRARYELVAEFADEAVRGADLIETREGFKNMLARIAGNGVRVVIVENASRFARDLVTQELGFRYLQALGVKLIAADSPDTFVDDGPTATMVRQVLGAVSQFEKAGLVAKLKAARDRRIAAGKKCGGRKSLIERDPVAVALARLLAKEGKTLRAIASELAATGHLAASGKPYAATAINRMLAP
ncbi:MAG TPA: recombinase family protein, partial [Steroidobacteraceae bacterium]|nr:recombinase family protein [Steroidobacteraceae bacterium]